MWHTTARKLLWCTFAAMEIGFLCSMILTCKNDSDDILFAIVLFVIESLVNVTALSFLHALLDFFENTISIKHDIKYLRNSRSDELINNQGEPNDNPTSDPSTSTERLNEGYSLDRLKRISGSDSTVAGDFWHCTACGEKNNKLDSICKSCGKYK